MRTYRRICVLSLVMAAALISAATTVPQPAYAAKKARVMTRDLATGIVTRRSNWIEAEKAATLAAAISFDTIVNNEMISCWTVGRKHWFNPFPPRRIRFVRSYYVKDGSVPQHPKKQHRQ